MTVVPRNCGKYFSNQIFHSMYFAFMVFGILGRITLNPSASHCASQDFQLGIFFIRSQSQRMSHLRASSSFLKASPPSIMTRVCFVGVVIQKEYVISSEMQINDYKE
jgi:hypothetical protein